MAEMRTLLGILRDEEERPAPRAPAPALADVEALVGPGRRGRPADDAEVDGRSRVPLPAGVDLAAYRIVQEALTNCLKHSGATRADVDVTPRRGHGPPSRSPTTGAVRPGAGDRRPGTGSPGCASGWRCTTAS